jgi:hypothetical protein
MSGDGIFDVKDHPMQYIPKPMDFVELTPKQLAK